MSQAKKTTQKYCLVPCCTNTTNNSADKLFFSVPKDFRKRKAWLTAMKRDEKKNPQLSSKTTHWCCEDHFSLEEDMENFWQWHLTKDVKRLKLKEGILPHVFDCQKKKVLPPNERKGALKRKHLALVQEALSSVVPSPSSIPSPSSVLLSSAILPTSAVSSISFNTEPLTSASFDGNVSNKIIQVDIKKKFRSKGVNTDPVTTSAVACSPVKFTECLPSQSYACSSSERDVLKIEEDEIFSESTLDAEDESDCSENYSSEDENAMQKYKQHMLKGTIMSIEKNPKIFLGLPAKSYFLVKLILEEAPIPINNLFVVLKKLKLDLSFTILAIDFGISVSTASRAFSKALPILAQLMQDLIVWPKVEDIRFYLPIPFRARYLNVISIIDCLEIEIEKPSNPLHQALTWSKYYDCNTLKYLLSCTPDGLVSFISEGYGGRTSDVTILEDCGYLDKLVPGTSVMADRGFKHISSLLQQKGCMLVRPPSVSPTTVSSKTDVRLSKRIAALRIHVERVIGRLREFKMLGPHACVDNHLIPFLDFSIIVACGLINMQDHLIKKQM